jgi:hypothetical protein
MRGTGLKCDGPEKRGGPLVWLYVGLICLVGMWPDFVLNKVAVPLTGSLLAGVLGSCAYWLLLTALLGFLGGRCRNRWVTLGGTALLVTCTHVGKYLYLESVGASPRPRLMPDTSDAHGMLFLLGYGIVVAVIAHALTVRMTTRHVPGRCSRCDYDLTGNVSGVCPECGTSTDAER